MVTNKDVILIDVDNTFVDSATAWLQWMEEVYNTYPNSNLMESDLATKGKLSYNLGDYFPDEVKTDIHPMDFWEDPYLYDKLIPYEGAIEVISKLHETGHPIRFVSYCKKGHLSSKVRLIRRSFPNINIDKGPSGFYATKYKSGVSGSVIIDDRNDFLNQFSNDIIKIRFDSEYQQFEEPRVKYDLCTENWYKIGDFLQEVL